MLNSLLLRARLSFETYGRIRYDIAVRLMQHGVIVPELEDKWSRANG